MPKIALSEAVIAKLKPPASGRADYTDSRTPGLTLRLTATGHGSWSLRYRPRGGKPERLTLGSLKAVTLAEARQRAKALNGSVADGQNPQAIRRKAKGAMSFDALADAYLTGHAMPGKASWKNDLGYLKRARSAWAGRSAESIVRSDVVALLEAIRATAPVSANRTRSVLVTLFNWAVETGLIPANPAAGVRARTKETPRERVLTVDEVRDLWAMTGPDGSMDPNIAGALRLILLTGQRPGEIAGLVRTEICDLNDGTRARIELPASRTKARRSHLVPLCPLAAALVREGIARNVGSDAVFASAFASRTTLARHSLSQALRRKKLSYTPHDLRRSCLTGLASLGIPREDRLAVAAHAPSDIHGAHYDKYERMREKRAALVAWETRIGEMVGAGRQVQAA
ncbi:tyrosine-type recombinase/integrase [Microvirga sesbaniae]|uniref:tyrosine-type recombinase/integrase n=1 Tax=Microvirga sesbaniae TaxID=681392 RepID=UPI0021CA7569|nr:site-specific integrase [Microvirga sp. HBU67692]